MYQILHESLDVQSSKRYRWYEVTNYPTYNYCCSKGKVPNASCTHELKRKL